MHGIHSKAMGSTSFGPRFPPRSAGPDDCLPGLPEPSIDDEDPGQMPEPAVEWSEDDIVQLHWRLLQEVRHLADPATPLGEKLDTLRWVFTEREKDARPFSFVSCLRVVGCSPLSPIAYCGRLDAEEVRDRIRHGMKAWLEATLARYPDWVRTAVAQQPNWIADRLSRNPQWINEQMRQRSIDGDLFT